MNKVSISSIREYSDINSIDKDTKYINIPIDKNNNDIVDYFLNNGREYTYSDIINDKNGFIYTSYDMFKVGEECISSIIKNMPNNLSDLEKVRYLYISLGKLVGYDINLVNDKNEVIPFMMVGYLNNIWSALYYKKVTNLSIVKLLVYLCSKINIKCDIVSNSISGNLVNKVYIGNSFLVVDLFKDLANIKGNFMTEHFDKYNSDKDMDKKVLYISDNYSDYYLDKSFNGISKDGDFLGNILNITFSILDINSINSYELLGIYKKIFSKYFSNDDIRISNFYLNNEYREHFIVFNYNDYYYSYNYARGCFIKVNYDYLVDNIKCNKIGLYMNESFNLRERGAL